MKILRAWAVIPALAVDKKPKKKKATDLSANPLGNVASRQPDKELYDKAMVAAFTKATGIPTTLDDNSTGPLLTQIASHFTGTVPQPLRNEKRAWFTDTLEDVNGVANTIRKLTATCVANGHDLIVVTSRSSIHITDIPIKNFLPIGEFELPEYELQKLSFPPILQMIDFIQREGFTELIISTPGPIGLTALLAGKVLGLIETLQADGLPVDHVDLGGGLGIAYEAADQARNCCRVSGRSRFSRGSRTVRMAS